MRRRRPSRRRSRTESSRVVERRDLADGVTGYLVTPAGQASYQRDLVSLVASLPGHKGLGVFYWDGDSDSYQGMFAYPGIAQPVIDALRAPLGQ